MVILKSKFRKSISIALLAFFSWLSICVYAIDKTDTLGEDILNATSVQEIDNLLNDYYNISPEPIIPTDSLRMSTLSFPSDWMLLSNYSNGGTVYLNNFTGNQGLGYNLYKKIVYLNSTDATTLLKSMTNPSVLNFLKQEAISTLTNAAVTKIATLIGVSLTKAGFLIGLPAAFLVYAASTGNLRKLQNAITTAGNGKVRYDMYFMIQFLPSRTTFVTAYSPWVGNQIYVPRYYSEVGYKPGVIDMK